jgi:hypothetical protein
VLPPIVVQQNKTKEVSQEMGPSPEIHTKNPQLSTSAVAPSGLEEWGQGFQVVHLHQNACWSEWTWGALLVNRAVVQHNREMGLLIITVHHIRVPAICYGCIRYVVPALNGKLYKPYCLTYGASISISSTYHHHLSNCGALC